MSLRFQTVVITFRPSPLLRHCCVLYYRRRRAILDRRSYYNEGFSRSIIYNIVWRDKRRNPVCFDSVYPSACATGIGLCFLGENWNFVSADAVSFDSNSVCFSDFAAKRPLTPINPTDGCFSNSTRRDTFSTFRHLRDRTNIEYSNVWVNQRRRHRVRGEI